MLAKVAKLNESSAPYIMVVYFRFQEPTGSTLLQAARAEDDDRPDDGGAGRRELTKGIATYYEPFKKG